MDGIESQAKTETGFQISPVLLGQTMGSLLHAADLLSTEGYTGVSNNLIAQYERLAKIAGLDLRGTQS